MTAGAARWVVNTAEEGVVRTRIVAVEERIQTILQNPLGEDGLGRKKVWRVRPGNKIWSDSLGDKRATEVLKESATGVASGATWALRGTAQAVSSGASRVVYTYIYTYIYIYICKYMYIYIGNLCVCVWVCVCVCVCVYIYIYIYTYIYIYIYR